ncbi:MAG: sugar porter family MFS transporter [Prolixibacteraceae bacterium]|jgi:SP family arabinose:H+ symporter-like MFS transporter|nr:sugar porter family MFS transporter [Prolixibacteraceae bacterium]
MKEKDSRFLILVTVVATLGGLLFGFDEAVISGVTPFIQPYFNLGDIALGWTVSSLLVGCIIGVIACGKPGDLYGRRKILLVAALLFVISAVGSALSTSFIQFITFRLLGGIAVGAASILSPMYISEIAPADKRGALVSLNQLAIVTGDLVAYFSNYLLYPTGENNWRWMLVVMAAPALLFFVSLLFVPESPRWLMQKNRRDESFRILKKINGDAQATIELEAIEASVSSEGKASYKEVFSKKMRFILWIGILLAVFQQATGINAIMYYAPMIFKNLGSSNDSALIQTAIIGGVLFVFTLVAVRWIDRWGRKPLMIWGTVGMVVSLTFVTIAYFLNMLQGYFILLSILLFMASFAASIGPVTWVMISEIFPNKIRSEAMSVAIVALWIANFVVTLVFPVILNRLGGGVAFLIFDVMSVLLLLFVIFILPETKGKSLEELEKIFIKHK